MLAPSCVQPLIDLTPAEAFSAEELVHGFVQEPGRLPEAVEGIVQLADGDVFAPVVRFILGTVRLVLTVAAKFGLALCQADVTAAFVQSEMGPEEKAVYSTCNYCTRRCSGA